MAFSHTTPAVCHDICGEQCNCITDRSDEEAVTDGERLALEETRNQPAESCHDADDQQRRLDGLGVRCQYVDVPIQNGPAKKKLTITAPGATLRVMVACCRANADCS